MDNKERKFVRNIIEEQNRQSERIAEDQQNKNKEDELKKIQDMVERIRRTALYIKFVNDKGVMRAHVINRITRQLVAVIPWYLQGKDQIACGRDEYFASWSVNAQILSFYKGISIGTEVDREI